MHNVLISMCLCGINCRYDGKSTLLESLSNVDKLVNIIPICPEIIGGLPTPRAPVEIINGKAINNLGEDKTANFEKGANEVIKLVKQFNVKYAVLKENSPSCGVNYIYDGTFTGSKISGSGITTNLLKELGVNVYSENEIDELIKRIEKEV